MAKPVGARLAVWLASYYRLGMLEAAEIERMTLAQKLQTMELLWQSLADRPERVESPQWHKPVLESRLAKLEAGKGKFLTIEQLKKRLAKRAK